jgi:hypothetical protein
VVTLVAMQSDFSGAERGIHERRQIETDEDWVRMMINWLRLCSDAK